MKNALAILLILLCITPVTWAQQTVSDEARRHFDRGMAVIETAKKPADYKEAIREFEQAVQLAQEWADAYYNLGMVQEKAGNVNDAIENLRHYLRLSPDAADAQQVKSLINKLEYKQDKTQRATKVYDIMTSGDYDRNVIGDCRTSGADWLLHGPTSGPYNTYSTFRNMNGKMEVQIGGYVIQAESNGGFHPSLHPSIPREWEPVKVKDKFYEYKYVYYADISSGYVVRADVQVKGEIISTDPPQVKEKIRTVVKWGRPIPGDQDSKGRPWHGKYMANSECVFEWTLK